MGNLVGGCIGIAGSGKTDTSIGSIENAVVALAKTDTWTRKYTRMEKTKITRTGRCTR